MITDQDSHSEILSQAQKHHAWCLNSAGIIQDRVSGREVDFVTAIS